MSGLSCPECGASFASGDARRRHIAMAHRAPAKVMNKKQKQMQEKVSALTEGTSEIAALLKQQSGDRRSQTKAKARSQAMKVTEVGRQDEHRETDSLTESVSKLQQMEINHLISLNDKTSRAIVAEVKEATTHFNAQRAQDLSAYLTAKLSDCGIGDNSTLQEITSMVHQVLRPWQGMETAKREGAMQQKAYPHVEPRKRVLQSKAGKAKYAFSANDNRFVYDMPIEQQIDQEWAHQPEQHERMKAFLRQQMENQKSSISAWQEGKDWVIDDYYTAINGLRHPQLGKADSHLGEELMCCCCCCLPLQTIVLCLAHRLYIVLGWR